MSSWHVDVSLHLMCRHLVRKEIMTERVMTDSYDA